MSDFKCKCRHGSTCEAWKAWPCGYHDGVRMFIDVRGPRGGLQQRVILPEQDARRMAQWILDNTTGLRESK